MAVIPQALSPIANIIDGIIPDNLLIKFQEILIRSGMYVKASEILTLAFIASIFIGIIALVVSSVAEIDPIISGVVGFLIPPVLMGGYIFLMMERRVDAIEQTTPDFLRQVASLLRAGVGLETALEDVSKHGGGPLNDELKRAVIEIKIGRTFDDAIMSMGERLKSKNLDRTFRMILEGRRAGGSLSDVIETVAEDLRAVLALKRERKANVMMSVMFLIIAAIVAAPFALGMIMVYSGFIESLGKPNPLLGAAVTAAGGYIIIHSVIAGLLIGIILYGSAKKGVKFAVPLAIAAYGIFLLVGKFGILVVGG
ncbi:type II secretion system F family protein [Methanobacterium alcaliphilum]|uniref:type II secretion system F family protein n=1 Tax=Methanobacterium alcaliphilum TaxID=392018 RepID=UPI00200A6450|nr:type II secretion system F family protein [Methanobacterium alcaliphilum]MCK9150340.1 type II secretion system F family protein [Methanobacterium alcaliphilum]